MQKQINLLIISMFYNNAQLEHAHSGRFQRAIPSTARDSQSVAEPLSAHVTLWFRSISVNVRY